MYVLEYRLELDGKKKKGGDEGEDEEGEGDNNADEKV